MVPVGGQRRLGTTNPHGWIKQINSNLAVRTRERWIPSLSPSIRLTCTSPYTSLPLQINRFERQVTVGGGVRQFLQTKPSNCTVQYPHGGVRPSHQNSYRNHLQRLIDSSALCGANLITQNPRFRPQQNPR